MPTLDWLNRTSAFTTAAQVPYRLLEQVSAHGNTGAGSASTSSTDNLLIQGDNLEALKALLPFYRGQVKCIFIDPPYNTKSAFEHYDDNLEHAQWLSMMLPRLQLLRELLREDGSIWVTIDDNEGHYLKVLMDEVFGRGNFVTSFAWEKDQARHNDAVISGAHDQILLYAKVLPVWKRIRNLLPRELSNNDRYKNPDDDPRGPWLQGACSTAKSGTEKNRYPVTLPSGRPIQPPPGNYWRFSEETLATAISEKRAYFGKNGDRLPIIKSYLSEVQDGFVPKTLWLAAEVGSNQSAKRDHLRKLLADIEPFSTPKPEGLLQRILHIATNPGDLVLDSFLGSGTTAAVAHKMGRRWIGIEMGEHAATHCLPRLEKVIAGEQGGISKAVGWGPSANDTGTLFADGGAWNGGGFRFMRLGAPVFDARGRIHPDVRFATLAAFVWQQETGTALAPAAAQPGTPYLGTHYTFDSCLRTEDAGQEPISLIKTPQFAAYLLFNGILGDKRPASGNVLTQAVLDALLALHAQIHATGHPAPDGTEPTESGGLGGSAFCAGQGGARAAGGGHGAERTAAQAPGASPTPAAAIPLLVFGEACRLGSTRLKLANVTFKHIPYDVKAR
jgi:adenine-specific DNA-methyltransferase